LQSVSPAIDAGTDLGASYDDSVDIANSTFPGSVALLDQDLFGSAWEIGPVYTGGAIATDPLGYINVGSITEATIRSDGVDFYIDLTDAEWVATMGDDNSITTAFIAALDGNLSCDTCWDSIVKATLTHSDITRTSATRLTIATGAFASFDLSVSEIVSLAIPANCTTAGAIINTNSFPIAVIQDPVASKGMFYLNGAKQIKYLQGGKQILYKAE